MDKILVVKNLKKVYGAMTEHEFEALHDIDFEVDRGEFICVMGPSGSGKSTFINNISTIDFPTSGLVYINGEEIHTMSSKRIGMFRYENLGFIFQNYNLLETHTLYENIAVPLSLKHEKDIPERVAAIAKRMGIEHLLDKYPHECSGGQQQRASICRALINHPELIIADEPTGNLDRKHSIELLEILKSMNNEGVTIIMVTHDPLDASYSSRLVYIEDGRITEEIKRDNKTQEEYFEEISELNTRESKGAIHDI